VMSLLIFSLVIMSALDRWPVAAQAAPRPALAATPRLIVVVQTAAPEPTPIPAPTATAVPAPEPIVVVQYVEVPVVVPATVAPPVVPTVSHTRIEGWVEMERPPVFEGQPARRPGDMPEAAAP
jgi:hypothetical protein